MVPGHDKCYPARYLQFFKLVRPRSPHLGDGYPLVNIQKPMENHHVSWENLLEMAMFNSFLYVYQRVNPHVWYLRPYFLSSSPVDPPWSILSQRNALPRLGKCFIAQKPASWIYIGMQQPVHYPSNIHTLWLWLTVCHGIDGPFIGGLPIKNMVTFHGYVKYPKGIYIIITMLI